MYSTCFGNVRYQKTLDDGNLEFKKMSNGETFSVNVFGQIDYSGECVLFPAKDIKCWEGDWQSIVMPKSVGSVIVAGDGKTYAISKDCVLAAYPTLVGNDVPKDKFDFKNARYANNVERAEFFEKAAAYGFYWNADLCDFVGAKANRCVVCVKDIDTERTRSGEVKHDIVSVDKDVDVNKPTEAIWYGIEPFAREQILTNLDKNSIISIREVSNGQ